MTEHAFPVRVYYEDTDAGGIVYNANYLKFAERARTEMLREKGIYQTTLKETTGLVFVLRHADMKLLKPARLDDFLMVCTKIKKIAAASLHLLQEIRREKELLVTIHIEVVCVSTALKPRRIPGIIKESLAARNHK